MPSGTKAASSVAVKPPLSRTPPWSKLDNVAQKDPYVDHRNAHNYNGATDRVVEPLTRLLQNLSPN